MSKPLDQELNLKAIVGFAVGLVLICALSGVALWYFSGFLRGYLESQDPPPPTLEAARATHTPPGPPLQTNPVADLSELRARETAVLDAYGWVDRANGIASIPVERAISLMVDNGGPTETLEATPPEEVVH